MKTLAALLFGLSLAMASAGCCCGHGCGMCGGGYGAGYGARGGCCPTQQPCNPCGPTYGPGPTYGTPLQGSYIVPSTTQAGIPALTTTAAAVPLDSLPTY